MKTRILNFRPPAIAQLLVVIAVMLHWATPIGAVHIYSNGLIALALGLTGFGVMMWGWWLFRRYKTAISPTAKAGCLITSGIYRITRNPMYLGMIAMLLSMAAFVGSLPFYLVTGVYFLLINNVFCTFEEAKLAESFGATYQRYKSSVRRWL